MINNTTKETTYIMREDIEGSIRRHHINEPSVTLCDVRREVQSLCTEHATSDIATLPLGAHCALFTKFFGDSSKTSTAVLNATMRGSGTAFSVL